MPEKMIGKKPWNKGDKYKTFIEGIPTETFPHIPEDTDPPSWQEIEKCKMLSTLTCAGRQQLETDWRKLCHLDVSENVRSFAGNRLIHHYFTKEMIKTRYKGGKTLEEKYKEDPMKMWKQVCQMDRRKASPPNATDVFELNRAITFFKPSIAKYIYKKYNATSVFDACAGWGGRLLGALSLGIDYVGCDTNTSLQPIYQELIKKYDFPTPVSMVYPVSCLDYLKSMLSADALEVQHHPDFDCVLTSPPYANLEVYPEMTPWKSDEVFYKKFLMPMISRCYKLIKKGGVVCINMSPKMYDAIIKLGFPACHEAVDFLQQKNVNGKGKQDFIYVWRKL